jgi:hypothetical protein
LIKLEPSNGTAHYKLGVVMTNEKNPNYDKQRAVECYKQAIDNVNGENYKQKIALTLHSLLVSLNREFEISAYKQYLPEGTLADDALE